MTIFSDSENVGDRYTIEKYLDEGGMQEVYIAYDSVLLKKVALKTPKNHHAEKRFKRSAVMSARVNHFNVAKTLDYFEYDGKAILIEELIGGSSLDKLLETDYKYFDPYLAAQFGHHMVKGLAAFHHVDVIHRDLKPGNIMVEKTDNCYSFKITDFGIAKLTEEEFEEAHKDESSITGSHTMMGAIPYMAPEMIKGPKNATKASDVWSVGAILYKLITGEYPFGTGLSAIPRIDKAELPPKPDKEFHRLIQYSSLVNDLWEIIQKCFQKDDISRLTADILVGMFGELCYGSFPRYQGEIKNYKMKKGNWGFINCGWENVFFHRQCYFGNEADIESGQRVEFSRHKGGDADRVYPMLPLKH